MSRESYIDYVEGLDLNELFSKVLWDDKPQTELDWWKDNFDEDELVETCEGLFIDNLQEDEDYPSLSELVNKYGIKKILDCFSSLYDKAVEHLEQYLIDNYSEDDYRPDYDD